MLIDYLFIHYRTKYGESMALEHLMETDNDSLGPLEWAADSGSVNIIEYLLRIGIPIGLHRYKEETAATTSSSGSSNKKLTKPNRCLLYYAVLRNRVDAVRFLVKCGWNPFKIDFTSGESPYKLAKRLKYYQVLRVIDNIYWYRQPSAETDRNLLLHHKQEDAGSDGDSDHLVVDLEANTALENLSIQFRKSMQMMNHESTNSDRSLSSSLPVPVNQPCLTEASGVVRTSSWHNSQDSRKIVFENSEKVSKSGSTATSVTFSSSIDKSGSTATSLSFVSSSSSSVDKLSPTHGHTHTFHLHSQSQSQSVDEISGNSATTHITSVNGVELVTYTKRHSDKRHSHAVTRINPTNAHTVFIFFVIFSVVWVMTMCVPYFVWLIFIILLALLYR